MNLHVLHGTCEYIKSYERERAMMVVPIVANVLAQHKANVSFERKMFGSFAGHSVRPSAANSSPSDEAIEIRDGRGFNSGRRQEYMEQGTVRT